jgi:carboxypeptidase Q
MRRTAPLLFAASLLLAPAALPAAEPVDLDMVNRIRDEGFHRSRVMDLVGQLTDVIGPRITGSPQMKQANEWTRDQLAQWGLANAHLEPFFFGRGWSFSRVSVHLLRPQAAPLLAYPKGFTPGTHGPVRGPAVRAKLEAEKDFDAYRGQLAGKIVFLDEAHDLSKAEAIDARRYSAADLEALAQLEPSTGPSWTQGKKALEAWKLRQAMNRFLTAEGALATVEVSNMGWGQVRVGRGGTQFKTDVLGVASLVMAAEPYNRILRLLDRKQPVELEVDVQASYHDEDPMAYNTVAELPGTAKDGEIVMAGAHLDSWHSSTGATDNAAGCAMVLEAARILKALGVKPRRTIRVALWSGEEEGILGSQAYVDQHFAEWAPPADPDQKILPGFMRKPKAPLTLKPEFGKLAAYFNLDNGSGKVRGVYAQENAAVVPIFTAWLAPFHDLGADTVTTRRTGSTDHVPFDHVGLPGFQFIQDELDYRGHTHHTNLDSYDHLEEKDLMQGAVVLAAFLYDAAMRPEMLPRKPVPKGE